MITVNSEAAGGAGLSHFVAETSFIDALIFSLAQIEDQRICFDTFLDDLDASISRHFIAVLEPVCTRSTNH
jgi:hypothetical protein